MDSLDKEIERLLEPFRSELELLCTIPGVGALAAQTIVAEIGTNMRQFPTAPQLISWAGLRPQLRESAGKRKNTRIRRGAPWLKPLLVQAAWAAVRNKDCYYRAQFYRLKARRGPKKAITAVAASILTAAFHILRDQVPYRDLGQAHFDRTDKQKVTSRLLRRLSDLGFDVQLTPRAA